MTNQSYDAIVLGLGGVGSAALYALAKRHANVIGIDLFDAGHSHGSSHGETRVIRQAYFEHADYVPLAVSAYDMWADLMQTTGRDLFHQTGLLQAGPADGAVVRGVLEAAELHGLEIDRMDGGEANRKYAPLQFSETDTVLLESCAGYLRVEDCVKAHLSAASWCSARLVHGERVLGWEKDGQGVIVRTNLQTYRAQKLVLALGAGSAALCQVALPIHVLRKHQYWFTGDAQDARLGRLPIYLVEAADEVFYGFPRISQRGMKLARHTGGYLLEQDPFSPAVDALESDAGTLEERADQRHDQALVERFLEMILPNVVAKCSDHTRCLYSMSSDGHFYVGQHPTFDGVFMAAGLSGHGFKFTPVIGAALAELVLENRTSHPIEFLAPNRP